MKQPTHTAALSRSYVMITCGHIMLKELYDTSSTILHSERITVESWLPVNCIHKTILGGQTCSWHTLEPHLISLITSLTGENLWLKSLLEHTAAHITVLIISFTFKCVHLADTFTQSDSQTRNIANYSSYELTVFAVFISTHQIFSHLISSHLISSLPNNIITSYLWSYHFNI